MSRLYLYLASRKKTGVKVITVLQGEATGPILVSDITALKLPQIWERQIAQIIYENRMDYEPWIESAVNFAEIENNLKARGYTNLPIGFTPLLNMQAYSKSPIVDLSSFSTRKIMLKKGN